MPSTLTPVSLDELAALPTARLLALRDRLLACVDSLAASDLTADEVDVTTIQFKDDPRWTVLYDAVKAVLSTREHVRRPAERRVERDARMRSRTPRRKP